MNRFRRHLSVWEKYPTVVMTAVVVLGLAGWHLYAVHKAAPSERVGVTQKALLKDLRGLMESSFDNNQEYPQVGGICASLDALKPAFEKYPKARQEAFPKADDAGSISLLSWLFIDRHAHSIQVGVSGDGLHYVFLVDGQNDPAFSATGKTGKYYGCDCAKAGVYCATEDMPME